MSIKRLIGAVAMASMVTAATFQTLYALTPPPPGTPPATHTPPQNYTGIAIIDGNSAPRGTVVAASANLIPDVEGVVGANGTYSLEIPTHHYSLGYMGGMRLNFTVAGMPAVETAILGIGPVVLNLTVITPPTDTPAPTAITPATDTPASTAIAPATDTPASTASVQRQTVPPSGVLISFTSDRSELTVADPVTLTLGVMYPEDHTVVLPRIGPEWGPFEVRSQATAQTISNGDGTKTTFRQFQVTLFATGEFETPELPIAIRHPDGSVEEVFPTPLRLTVNSVLTGPDEQLKDIRSPADLSTPFWERPAMIALGTLVALAALGSGSFFFYRRSRPRQTFLEPLVDTRQPWEVALQELGRIEGLNLPGKGDLKGHYTLVAGTLRAYLGATYLSEPERMDATDMSSEEIGAAIWRSPLDHGNARIVIELLQEADLVKFANYTPPASRAYEAAGQVRTVVEATRLAYEEASSQQRTSLRQGAAR